MAALSIDRLRLRFGTTEILKGIDLSIESGEFIVLVGPSGCGKSTLLNVIAGLERANEGHLAIGGRDVTGVPPKDRDIAMVFQSYALYPAMSVAQNIMFGMECRGIPRAERKIALERVSRILKIEALLDRKPSQLSGGQRQRVAMGRALVRDPVLFLFDEPLSNLDAKLRVEMRMEIKRLHARVGTTMIYVTHDQVEAMTLATRIAVMNGGEIQQFADPQTIYDEPSNLFVARFMGSPPMNAFPAKLEVGPAGVGARIDGAAGRATVMLGAAYAKAEWQGREVYLGIRPECLSVTGTGEPGSIPGRVDLVEPMGAETMLLVTVGEHEITARVGPEVRPRPGDVVHLAVDSRKACLFDIVSEKRIV